MKFTFASSICLITAAQARLSGSRGLGSRKLCQEVIAPPATPVPSSNNNNSNNQEAKAEDAPCPLVDEPYSCFGNMVVFPNKCEAEKAGYGGDDCHYLNSISTTSTTTSSISPTISVDAQVDTDSPCPTDHIQDPVLCHGDMIIESMCEATRLGLSAQDCEPISNDKTSNPTTTTATFTEAASATINEDTVPSSSSSPCPAASSVDEMVICQGDMLFDSLCSAVQVGLRSDECVLYGDFAGGEQSFDASSSFESHSVAQQQAKEDETPCAYPSDTQVLCQGDMIFPNQCEAEKYGMTAEDCEPF